jgi:hypothetical protein
MYVTSVLYKAPGGSFVVSFLCVFFLLCVFFRGEELLAKNMHRSENTGHEFLLRVLVPALGFAAKVSLCC